MARAGPPARGGSADARVAVAAAEQWGVLCYSELRGLGLSKWAILRRERAGRLHRLHPAVYAVGYVLNLPEARWLAAVKACGQGAVLSHRSAAQLWGLIPETDSNPEVTIPALGGRRISGIRIHESRFLGPAETTRRREIPATTAARTLVDLAMVVNHRTLRQAVRRAQGFRHLSLPMLLTAIRRLGPRRGSVALRRIVATGPAPTVSETEDVLLDLVVAGGFEHPDVNKAIRLAGRRLVPDFRWPGEKLVVEADGAAWHDQKVAREDDAERQALLEAHGERVIRVTWAQVVSEPNVTLRRIAAAGAPRSKVS